MRVLLLIGLSLLGGGEILPGGWGASGEPSGGAAGPAGGSSAGSLSSSGYGFGPGSGSELDPSSVGESPSPVSCVGGRGGALAGGVTLLGWGHAGVFHAGVFQACYIRYQASFYLWRIVPLLKYYKVLKYNEQDCQRIFCLLLTLSKMIEVSGQNV